MDLMEIATQGPEQGLIYYCMMAFQGKLHLTMPISAVLSVEVLAGQLQ
jgi:hypothetical protein